MGPELLILFVGVIAADLVRLGLTLAFMNARARKRAVGIFVLAMGAATWQYLRWHLKGDHFAAIYAVVLFVVVGTLGLGLEVLWALLLMVRRKLSW